MKAQTRAAQLGRGATTRTQKEGLSTTNAWTADRFAKERGEKVTAWVESAIEDRERSISGRHRLGVTVEQMRLITEALRGARWCCSPRRRVDGGQAAGGLFGHAVAVHIWRIRRGWSILLGLICVAALVPTYRTVGRHLRLG
jgi:hypothetical protein